MMAAPHNESMMTLDALLQGYTEMSLPVVSVNGICSDSQLIKAGNLFVAQSGISRHAIDYVADAIKAGAIAVAYDVDDEYSLQRIALLRKQFDALWIPVHELRKVTGEIVSRFYGNPSHQLKLVGITGTDGKTSVTHMLVQALNRLQQKAGSIGTLGYGMSNQLKMTRFTTPDAITLQSILNELHQKGCQVVVMEVSSHALEQYRVSGCQFDIAVLTNLGSDHLDYHGEHKYYAAAKSRLFAMDGLKARVVNLDDELGQRLAQRYAGSMLTGFTRQASCPESAAVCLLSNEVNQQGLRIVASCSGNQMDIQTGLIGDFNIENLLACIAVLHELGFKVEQIEDSLQGLHPIPGRMEYFPPSQQYPAVVIDFAHTEQALAACLKSVRGACRGKLFCVFGCGGDRDQSKRGKMAAVAEQLADQVILTDDNPRFEAAENIMQDILGGFRHPELVQVIHDRQVAIEVALDQASSEDLVVIAGKGHEQFQLIGDNRIPFSDRVEVKRILEEVSK